MRIGRVEHRQCVVSITQVPEMFLRLAAQRRQWPMRVTRCRSSSTALRTPGLRRTYRAVVPRVRLLGTREESIFPISWGRTIGGCALWIKAWSHAFLSGTRAGMCRMKDGRAGTRNSARPSAQGSSRGRIMSYFQLRVKCGACMTRGLTSCLLRRER